MRQIGDLKLYTVDELAALMGIRPKTIREYLKTGKLHGRKMAGRWYITEDAIAAYFERLEGGAPEPGREGD